MAVLPTPYTDRVVPSANRPVSSVSGEAMAAPGRAVARLGNVIQDTALFVQDREDTAAAKERDAYVSDEIRKILHDPETGFTNMYGRDAVSARNAALDRLKSLQELAQKDLSNGAKRKLDTSLTRRIDSAMQSIDQHTGTQRNVWLDGASAARIEAAEQDALAAGDISESFAIISGELTAKADREGWDAARLDVELGKAKSSLVYNQAVVLADKNPEFALEFVEKNSASLRPGDALKLKSTIEPLAKAQKGRRIGAEAALVGVSPNYLTAIRSAESGGNDAARNPNSTATGRYQFTAGTWSALAQKHPELGLTPQGRLDPAQQERAIRAFTADNAQVLEAAGISPSGGNLYAAHFLGAGGAVKVLGAGGNVAVSDLVGAEVIAANPFLAGMTVDRFKRWANSKGGGEVVAFSDNATPSIDALLDIEDPTVRRAALEEYELRSKVISGNRKQQLAAASDTAFRHVEAGNDPADLPLDVRQELGQDTMSTLRTYYGKIQSGETVETDNETYVMLRQMQANDPQGFSSLNMLNYVDQLSQSDFKSFVDQQAAGVSPDSGNAAATLMTVAKRQMEASGIDTTPKPGKAESAQVAAMQTRLLKWQDRFIQENGREPTQLEIDERVGRELVSVTMDAPGLFNKSDGYVFDVPDVDPEKLAKTGITIGDIDVPPSVVAEQIAAMEAEGALVTSDALVQRLAELMEGF